MNLAILSTSVLSGFLVALSPCNIPIYPIIMNIISSKSKNKRAALLSFAVGHALMYALFYVALAFFLKLAGNILFDRTLTIFYIIVYGVASIVCAAFALQNLGKIDFFSKHLGKNHVAGQGVFGAFVQGVFFATVVSPCNLPYLVIVYLPLLSKTNTMMEGLMGIILFTLSLSAPLLAIGLLGEYAFSNWIKRHHKKINRLSAVFLFVAALYFLYLSIAEAYITILGGLL